MGAGAYFKINVGRGYAHLFEEDIGKLFVIVLTSVDEDGLDFRVALHFAHQGAILGRLGALRRYSEFLDFGSLGK